MPYAWDEVPTAAPHGTEAAGRPVARLRIWPHRSLPPKGFALFIGITFALMMVPVVALLGGPSFWEMLPFPLAALTLTWVLLRRSYRFRLREELTISADSARLVRTEADGTTREWIANPYWVRVELLPQGGPVENYLILKGGPREVEIGAFLSPEERAELKAQLNEAFAGRTPR